jgi:hypothetical protein
MKMGFYNIMSLSACVRVCVVLIPLFGYLALMVHEFCVVLLVNVVVILSTDCICILCTTFCIYKISNTVCTCCCLVL